MEIFDSIIPNTTIITPNRRLSATLLKQYHVYQKNKGLDHWSTLDILPFQRWIERLWNDMSTTYLECHATLLTNPQEQLLWEKIISNDPKNDALLHLSASAELARSAWGILQQWQVTIDHPLFHLTEDSHAFQAWGKAFQNICQNKKWMDFNTLVNHIHDHIKNRTIPLPHKIIVAGFTELTPAQLNLLATCKKLQTQVQYIEAPQSKTCTKSYYISLSDSEAELLTMAKWAKKLITNDPTLTIACVIPDLENHRDRIKQLFSSVLNEPLFNISAGKRLTEYPIIHTAIKILQIHKKLISLENMSHLLLTPFIGEAEIEFTQRALFECKLRKENIHTLHLSELDRFNIKNFSPFLSKRVTRWIQKWETLPTHAHPSQWVEHMIDILSIIGWPGERSLNSQEYQVVQRFLEGLNEFQSFDVISEPIDYNESIYQLERLVQHLIFQPQSNDAPIQVLGLLEASNLPFDHTWIMGLDDTQWPPAAKPNPFIPYKLQKSLLMPHATADKELQYSQKLTDQLKKSTNEIIFSHASTSNESELRPSALISDHTRLTVEELVLADFTPTDQQIYASKNIEILVDNHAPSIPYEEKITGGVNILKYQAACPFKAFATIRLKARTLEPLWLGLRPQDRGTLTHKALELLWDIIKDHEHLIKLDKNSLEHMIEQCCKEAMNILTPTTTPTSKYLMLEAKRLKKLLYQWMMLERKRPPFKVIAIEKATSLKIHDLELHLRIDRIDTLENGDLFIIDYKTTPDISVGDWFSHQPEEPQLPLYCLSDLNIKAMAFAKLSPGQLSIQGISETDIGIDKVKPLQNTPFAEIKEWHQQIDSWKTTFTEITQDFLSGNAAVKPKNKKTTCQYCDIKPFCRIHESWEPLVE